MTTKKRKTLTEQMRDKIEKKCNALLVDGAYHSILRQIDSSIESTIDQYVRTMLHEAIGSDSWGADKSVLSAAVRAKAEKLAKQHLAKAIASFVLTPARIKAATDNLRIVFERHFESKAFEFTRVAAERVAHELVNETVIKILPNAKRKAAASEE